MKKKDIVIEESIILNEVSYCFKKNKDSNGSGYAYIRLREDGKYGLYYEMFSDELVKIGTFKQCEKYFFDHLKNDVKYVCIYRKNYQ